MNDHGEKEIDTQRSSLVIYVWKAGLFSAAGHEHWGDAPIADGVILMGDALSVRLVVKAAKLTVRLASPHWSGRGVSHLEAFWSL